MGPDYSKTYIALCALYYRGPKSTTKQELFDHNGSTCHYLCSKYGHGIDFIIAGDTNRLNLSPILNLSPNLQQVVKVPTRLNPDRTLDPIITTLGKYYCEPITKPPLNPDVGTTGKILRPPCCYDDADNCNTTNTVKGV